MMYGGGPFEILCECEACEFIRKYEVKNGQNIEGGLCSHQSQ